MTRFTAQQPVRSHAEVLPQGRLGRPDRPELLPELTPYLHRIDVEGDRWTWNVAKVPMLGKSIGTTFTEVMTFEEPQPDRLHARPGAHRRDERRRGRVPSSRRPAPGTHVSIDLGVTVDLPFPQGHAACRRGRDARP